MSAHVSSPPRIGAGHAEVRRALAVKRGQHPTRLLIDGVWAHRGAIDAGVVIDTVFAVPELLHSAEASALYEACRVRADGCYLISARTIDRLSERHRPDGLVSIVEPPSWTPEQAGRGVSILVADADDGLPYATADLRGPTALVFGNERHGPAEAWQRFGRIRIPMLGRADSLNVAVSAGVLLYQARAQRDGW